MGSRPCNVYARHPPQHASATMTRRDHRVRVPLLRLLQLHRLDVHLVRAVWYRFVFAAFRFFGVLVVLVVLVQVPRIGSTLVSNSSSRKSGNRDS